MIPKIAVYCVNYGNYRNELKYGIDNIYVDKNIDYYFFTDNKTLKSQNGLYLLQKHSEACQHLYC